MSNYNYRNPPTQKTATPLSINVGTLIASDNQQEGKMSSRVTNYESHSTVQPKLRFGLDSSNSDSDIDRNSFGWRFSFYPTFGTKYPDSEADAVDDTTGEESTTEQIDIEILEKQLLDVLDKLAERQNNE